MVQKREVMKSNYTGRFGSFQNIKVRAENQVGFNNFIYSRPTQKPRGHIKKFVGNSPVYNFGLKIACPPKPRLTGRQGWGEGGKLKIFGIHYKKASNRFAGQFSKASALNYGCIPQYQKPLPSPIGECQREFASR